MNSKELPFVTAPEYIEEPGRGGMNPDEAERLLIEEIARLRKADRLIVENKDNVVTFRRPDGSVIMSADTHALGELNERAKKFMRRLRDPDLAGAPHFGLGDVGRVSTDHARAHPREPSRKGESDETK